MVLLRIPISNYDFGIRFGTFLFHINYGISHGKRVGTYYQLKLTLRKRKVVQDAYCEECRTKAESIQHVLWTCPKAKEAWECSKMVVSMWSSHCQIFQDLMWLMMIEDQLEVDKIARVVTIAWAQIGRASCRERVSSKV